MSSKKSSSKKILDECCIHEDVMKQIHDEKITMRPKTYFVVGSALQGAGMAGAAIVSVFCTNVVIHKLRYDDVFGYMEFGGPGIRAILDVFPWVPFVVAIGGLVGGSHLLSKYEVSYKHRYTRIFIAFVALIITLGFLLDRVGVNKHIEKMAPLKPLYDTTKTKPYVHGRVEYVQGNIIVVSTPYNEEVRVLLESTPEARIQPGSRVRAIGEWKNADFQIHHVRFYAK